MTTNHRILVGAAILAFLVFNQRMLRAGAEVHPVAPVSASAPSGNGDDYRPITRADLHKLPHERLTLEELEVLGQLPVNPWPEEQMLAEMTTWWGQPIDPKTYWKDRSVWHDPKEHYTTDRGRQCPPIPFDDPTIRQCSTQDWQLSGLATPDGYTPRYVSNDYEQNFWAKWARLLPRPPKLIYDAQLRMAQSIMSSERRSRQSNQRGRPITSEDVERYWDIIGRSAISDGCPPEAFERRAIYVAFVLSVCQKQGTAALAAWCGIVPDEFLDAPEERLREMDREWKRAYLERLKEELPRHPQMAPFLDGYLKAYSEAWAL